MNWWKIKVSHFLAIVIISKSDAVVWRERDANPLLTFAIKKRIKTELFIDRTAGACIVDGRIKNVVHGGQALEQVDQWIKRDVNQVMIFPFKKRINTELFIDWMAALYIMDGCITNVVKHGSSILVYAKSTKRYVNEKSNGSLYRYGFNRNLKEIAHYP